MEESGYGGMLDGVHLRLRRSPDGLVVNISAVKEVEDFIRGLGNGELSELSQFGGLWFNPTDQPIMVYNLEQNIKVPDFTLANIGEPLANEQIGRANLSFLRFKGISEPGGVSVGIRGPMSRSGIRGLGPLLSRAANRLVDEYIAPCVVDIKVLLQYR